MFNLILDDLLLCIVPAHPWFEEILKYEYKEIVTPNPEMPWITKQKREIRVIYKKRMQDGVEAIVTHQGMWFKVKALCEQYNIPHKLNDLRLPFPAPRLELMHGFRFQQETLLKQFLGCNCSGCLCAPTRYGKTTLIINTLRAYTGITTVVTVPGKDLIRQTYNDIKEQLPHREVVMIGGGSSAKNCSEDITVCSMDSLHKCDHGRTRLLVVDEPHSVVTNSRAPEIRKFDKARKLGFGATLEGRWDGRDIVLEALVGPTLVKREFRSAVKEGAICNIVVLVLRLPFNPQMIKGTTRTAIYNDVVWKSEAFTAGVADICWQVIPAKWQTLVFIENAKQAERLATAIGEETKIAMAMKLSPSERDELRDQMQAGTVFRCVASDIYAQGVTFHDLRVVINAAGGGANIGCIQKPGRLAEIRPGKSCGVMIDFLIDEPPFDPLKSLGGSQENWRFLINDSQARLETYRNKQYEVHICESMADLQLKFNKYCT